MFAPPWNTFSLATKQAFSLLSLSLCYLPREWSSTLLVHSLDPSITVKATMVYFLLFRKWSISDNSAVSPFLGSGNRVWYTILYSLVFLQILSIRRSLWVFNFFPVHNKYFLSSHYSFGKYLSTYHMPGLGLDTSQAPSFGCFLHVSDEGMGAQRVWLTCAKFHSHAGEVSGAHVASQLVWAWCSRRC